MNKLVTGNSKLVTRLLLGGLSLQKAMSFIVKTKSQDFTSLFDKVGPRNRLGVRCA